MEEQVERENPLDGRGATPSMGLSQHRGGRRKVEEDVFRESARLPEMSGGIVMGDQVGMMKNPFGKAMRQGSALMEHLHKLHGGSYARAFHQGMNGGASGRYEGKGFWDDFKKGFNMVFEPAAKVLKVASTALGQPEIAAGLSAIGYGKVCKMAEEMRGCGRISKKEHEALQAVLNRHKGGMSGYGTGGLDMKKILRMSMPLVEQMLGMGLPKTHYNKLRKMMEGMDGMKGGMSLERKVGGAKHKKEAEACESDSDEELDGGMEREMPPLYAMKRKNFPVNRGGKRPVGASDGRRKRAEIVRKVMAERGVKMIEASKIVKQEGLY
jgi:hypothetical protein